MDDATKRAFDVEIRLPGLATDILEHGACEGCRTNAAQALEFLGTFEDTLERLGVEDPRKVHDRRFEALRAQAAAVRPPHLRLGFDADIVVGDPSKDFQDRISSAVTDAVEQAIAQLPGATLAAFSAAVRIDVT